MGQTIEECKMIKTIGKCLLVFVLAFFVPLLILWLLLPLFGQTLNVGGVICVAFGAVNSSIVLIPLFLSKKELV